MHYAARVGKPGWAGTPKLLHPDRYLGLPAYLRMHAPLHPPHLRQRQQLGHAPDHLLYKHGVGVAQRQLCRFCGDGSRTGGGNNNRCRVLVQLAVRLPSHLPPLLVVTAGLVPLTSCLPLEGLQAIDEDVEQAEPAVSSGRLNLNSVTLIRNLRQAELR